MRAAAYVILLTDRLRARTSIMRYHGCDPRIRVTCRGRETQILGRALRFSLHTARPPSIVLHGLPPASFHLEPTSPLAAPLWYEGWFACGPAPEQDWALSEGDIGSGGRVLTGSGASFTSLAGCSPNRFVLHLIAGHPGQPVAFIEEHRGQVRP
jgi:hypothetical protein